MSKGRADVKYCYLKITIADGFQTTIARFNGISRISLELMLTHDREFDDHMPPLLP